MQTKRNLNTNVTSHQTPNRNTALLGSLATIALLAAQPARADFDGHGQDRSSQVGTIFVIAMENHNFTQPVPTNSPQQIFGNPAAPFINSLLTPGNSNAVQVSYATAYYNAGVGVHPSEPNYVWAEAGSDFGVHTDADPRSTNGNTFYDQAMHLTMLLDAANVPWKNYQENVELSLSPTNSAVGTNGPVNPYYGTTQYNYAVKHNPMAFFADTATANVYPLAQLFQDLTNHTVGRYNWITPNQYNDAHSSLAGGFFYNGAQYTGDQSAIAVGDNFLAQVIPQIMATKEYQHNGVIIIWWDESEKGDDTNHTVPEIIISPLAKGNAYASSVPLNHSSDIKTVEEIFHLPFLNNPIPLTETNNDGNYNNVALVNDLSDLFVSGAIPAPSDVTVTAGNFEVNPVNGHVFQRVRLTNTSTTPVPAPLWLVLDNLSPNASLLNADGVTTVLTPLGSPFVSVRISDDGEGDRDFLRPHETKMVKLEFLDPSANPITYDARVLSVVPAP